MQKNARLSLIIKILTAFAVLISFSVIYGWFSQDVALVKLGPGLPPMVFNTALFFILLSFNLILDQVTFRLPLMAINIFVMVFSFMTIAQYSIPANFGIDELFFKDSLNLDLTHRGRMGPNTAFGFIILALAYLFHHGKVEKFKFRHMFPMVFFIFSILIGVMSFFGFIFSAERGYIWGSFTRMALQTGLCFLLIGSASLIETISSLSYLAQVGKKTKRLVILVFTFVIVATVSFWFLFCSLDAHKVNEIIKSENRHLQGSTILSLKNTLSDLESVARRLETGQLSQSRWKIEADQLVKHFDGLESLTLLGRDGEVLYSATEDRAADDINSFVKILSAQGLIEKGKQSSSPFYSSGILDHQGRGSFFAIIPILKNGVYNGLLVSHFIGQAYFRQFSLALDSYISLTSKGVLLHSNIDSNSSIIPEWGYKSEIKFQGLILQTTIIPAKQIVATHIGVTPTIVLVLGVFLSILMAAFVAAIYELKLARNRHAYDSQWQRAILNGTDLGIVSTDIYGKVVLINPAAEKLLGRSESEVVGKLSPDVWHEPSEILRKSQELSVELGHSVQVGMETFFAKSIQGKSDKGRWTIVRPNGETRQINLSVHALRSNNGEIDGFLEVLEDITDVEKQNQLIEEQRMKMVASAKMSSLGEMAAGIAHEVNNPLTVIKGMAKMIQMTTESEKVESMMIKQSAQTIENTVNRIAKIIGGLKTFARDSGNEEVSLVKVSFILEETIPFCAEKFKNKDVDLRIHYDHSVEIQCRPVQISQVILNLLNNAYDAIADLEEKWVELKVQKTEHSVLISVTDSGDGISEEVEQKMMLPFFTTKSLGRGTGLGLSISAGIIESHKGKLYYDRSSSKTKFVVELPFDY